MVVVDVDLSLVQARRALTTRRASDEFAAGGCKPDLALADERLGEGQAHVEHLAGIVDVFSRRVVDSFDLDRHDGREFAQPA